ncbi:MAG TPA: metal-dependent hydrolase [Gammaproteobacteria bacterium]|nr:metal-dependent hydrolase [Gammaproteobacteria bacterium]
MHKPLSLLILSIAMLLGSSAAWSQSGPTTRITWFGHSAFEITTPKGKVMMIDPWLSNPLDPHAKDGHDPVKDIEKVDYILITHGHFDHVGDAVELAKKTGARLVTNYELGMNMAKLLGYPKDQMGFDTLMNIGGEITIGDGEVMVHMTRAIHSSGMKNPKAGPNEPDFVYGGNPGGFVIKIKDGPTIYDTGDTAYFSDMWLIGKHFHPDIALINVGGHFGMEPRRAVDAAVAVKARYVVPHHYATFPVLAPNADKFAKAVKGHGLTPLVIKPGDTLTFVGPTLSR